MRIIFRELALTGVKYVMVDGKRRRRQKKFWQTLNPFNKNSAGEPKTSQEIYTELREQVTAWKADPNP